MSKKLIVASNNENKIREIKDILYNFPIKIISLKEAGINIDIEEDGETFMENAYKKASSIYNMVNNCMVIADDSGLMVDCLGGKPGVYSARFAGEHGNDKKNNKKLLRLMEEKKVEDRKAKFVCSMVLIVDKDKFIKVRGEVEGIIIQEERGKNGFGYDPLFYIPEYKKTFAQMDSKIKNSISHRRRALEKLHEKIEKFIQEA